MNKEALWKTIKKVLPASIAGIILGLLANWLNIQPVLFISFMVLVCAFYLIYKFYEIDSEDI